MSSLTDGTSEESLSAVPAGVKLQTYVALHHCGKSLVFDKRTFPISKEVLLSEVYNKLGIDRKTPFQIVSGSRQEVSYLDLRKAFEIDLDFSGQQRGSRHYIVVRQELDANGVPQQSMWDFDNTVIPRAQDFRVPKGAIETREVYEPEVAFEEFVDNSLQYVINSFPMIIKIKIDPEGRKISFLDTGEGISFDQISQWARPADPAVVVVPVKWQYPSKAIGIMDARSKNINHFSTLQSPEHNAQLGVLSWWGLGGKLGASNLGGEGCCLELKTQPRDGSKAGHAIVTPGSWLYECGQLIDFPTDPIFEDLNIKSFSEFTISQANVDRLLKDSLLDEYLMKLRTEFANVYYIYLIGHQNFAARIKALNEVDIERSISEPPAVWEPYPDVKVPTIFLNNIKIDPKQCFLHKCMTRARCSFSFRIEFPMESKDGDVSFEVNTSILYFAGVDEVPQYDPRITDSHSTRSTLAFWNGKLMFNQDINIFTDWKLTGLPPGTTDRVRALVHFSRTFKPKQNKEGIDDREALMKYRNICQTQKIFQTQIEGFLMKCHEQDTKSELIFEKGTANVIGVQVGSKTSVYTRRSHDLTTPPGFSKKSTHYYDVIMTNIDVSESPSKAKLIGTYASLDGDQYDSVRQVAIKSMEIYAKDISRSTQPPSQAELDKRCNAYQLVTPVQFSLAFSDLKNGTNVAKIRSGQNSIVATVKLVNRKGENIFTVPPSEKMNRLKSYRDGLDNWISNSKMDIQVVDNLSKKVLLRMIWDQQHKVWRSVADELTHLGRSTLDLLIKPSRSEPHFMKKVVTRIILEISAGEPANMELVDHPSEIILGKEHQVVFSLTDRQGIQLSEFDTDQVACTVTGAPYIKVTHKCSLQQKKCIVAFICTGRLATNKKTDKMKFSLAYGNCKTLTVPVAIKPGEITKVSFQKTPPLSIQNRTEFKATAMVTDQFGNSIHAESGIAIDGDFAGAPLSASNPISFTAASLLLGQKDSKQRKFQLKYPELQASVRDERVPLFIDSLTEPATLLGHYDFETSTPRARDGSENARCYPGDAVWFYSGGRNHFVRIHAFLKRGSSVQVTGNYFYAEGCDGNVISDLGKQEAVMSTTTFMADSQSLRVKSQAWILSFRQLQVLQLPSVEIQKVYYCRRAYQPATKMFADLNSSSTCRGIVEVPIIIGHSIVTSIKINVDSEEPLLHDPKLSQILKEQRITLQNSTQTVVASYVLVYRGKRVTPATQINSLGLNFNAPLVVSNERAALDEFNSTMRLVYFDKQDQQVLSWTDYRFVVQPSTQPFALSITCHRAESDAREAWVWRPNFSTKTSKCFLKAPGGTKIVFGIQVLSEAGTPCKVQGVAKVGDLELPVVDGKATYEVEMPPGKVLIEFKYEKLARAVLFEPELPAPQSLLVAAKPVPCGEILRVTADFLGANKSSARIPSEHTGNLRAKLARIDGHRGEPQDVPCHIFTSNCFQVIVESQEPLIFKSGTCPKYRLRVTDRGAVLEAEFDVPISVGQATVLSCKPKSISLKSDEILAKDIVISAKDIGGNDCPLPIGVEFKAVGFHFYGLPRMAAAAKDQFQLVIPRGTIRALRSATGIMNVRSKELSIDVPVKINPGRAPSRLQAALVYERQMLDTITVPAGTPVSDVRIDCDVIDEEDRILEDQQVELSVLKPNQTTHTVTLGQPVLSDSNFFHKAGNYKIDFSLKSKMYHESTLPPCSLTIEVIPDRATLWKVHTDRVVNVELDQPFDISGAITDRYSNLLTTTIRLSYTSGEFDVDLVDPSNPDSTLAELPIRGEFSAKVVVSLKERVELHEQKSLDLGIACGDVDQALFGSLQLCIKPTGRITQTRKRNRPSEALAPPSSLARAQQLAKKNELDAKAKALADIQHFLKQDSASVIVYSSHNASSYGSRSQGEHLVCSGYSLVSLLWPDAWQAELEERDIGFWKEIRLQISRYSIFLNTILVYEEDVREYNKIVQNFRDTTLKNKKVKFAFAQIQGSNPTPKPKPRTIKDRELVDFWMLFHVSEALPERVRAGIYSWLQHVCPRWKICLTKKVTQKYQNKDPNTILCLETGTIYKSQENFAAIEGSTQDYNGPLVRYCFNAASMS